MMDCGNWLIGCIMYVFAYRVVHHWARISESLFFVEINPTKIIVSTHTLPIRAPLPGKKGLSYLIRQPIQ